MAVGNSTTVRRLGRVARALLGWLAVACGTIALALAAGALIPANGDWREPAPGPNTVDLFVETNGVHTGLTLPIFAAGVNWTDDFPITDADPTLPATHIVLGWGSRDFYLHTPSWAQLKLSTALRAGLGLDSTLLHVGHLANPAAQSWRKPLRVSADQYRELAAGIRATRAPGGAIAGYGKDDVFYPAAGRYSVARTCNEWVGERLRLAGVRTGAWTPLSPGVMRWR